MMSVNKFTVFGGSTVACSDDVNQPASGYVGKASIAFYTLHGSDKK